MGRESLPPSLGRGLRKAAASSPITSHGAIVGDAKPTAVGAAPR